MAKPLKDWVESEVLRLDERSPTWLSDVYFFRDPSRRRVIDASYFFSPADGVLLYQKTVKPTEPIVDIKGVPYTLRDALRDPEYDKESLVIGIFMTYFDVHVNRIPYRGILSYRELPPIHTYNRPMLDVENSLLYDLRVDVSDAQYLRPNQRMVNRVYAPALGQSYYLLQIADYDVSCITPFRLGQNIPVHQGARFSQIRYGSQVDLVIPLSEKYRLTPVHRDSDHVQAGLDELVRVIRT
ncbi:phosphatidylserine decarboxylase [Streptomyces sp. NPDC055078]